MVSVYGMTADVVTADRSRPGPGSAIVVGGGIVGLSTAWFLQERGVEVTVVDRAGVAGGASWGNAGLIAPGLVPLHEPAMLRHGLSSLVRPTGLPGDAAVADPALGGFLARVAANRRWSSWTRAVRANLPFTEESVDAFEVLTANGVDSPIVAASVVAAFRTMRQAEGLLGVLDRLAEVGTPVTHTGLFGSAVRDQVPLASPELAVGVCIEDQRYVDSTDFTKALARSVVARGGVLHTLDATDVQAHRGGVSVRTGAGPRLEADAVVFATGAHLPYLAARCGVRQRLRTSHGFSLTVPVDRRVPSPIYLPEAGVTCTPCENGMRVATTVGFRSATRDPSARVRSVVVAVRPLLDGVRWHERGEVRNGVNVTTADGRPLIGATAAPGVYVAGGHDMWGFAHGPVTGRLLAELITTGRQPASLRAFDPRRAL